MLIAEWMLNRFETPMGRLSLALSVPLASFALLAVYPVGVLISLLPRQLIRRSFAAQLLLAFL